MTTPSDLRFLAIDPGTKRIGLAIGGFDSGLASRLTVLHLAPGSTVQAEAIEAIARHVEEEGATRLLIGLPLNMDGTEGKESTRVRRFGDLVAARTGLVPVYVDERLTSENAEAVARQTGWTKKSGKPIDDLAAALLLQGFLDECRAREARAALDNSEGVS